MPVCPYIYMFTHILFIKHSFWWKSLVYILLSSSAKRLSVLEQCFFSWWRTIVFLNIQYVTDFQVVLSKLTSVHSYHVTHCTSSAMLELVCISFSEMAIEYTFGCHGSVKLLYKLLDPVPICLFVGKLYFEWHSARAFHFWKYKCKLKSSVLGKG